MAAREKSTWGKGLSTMTAICNNTPYRLVFSDAHNWVGEFHGPMNERDIDS